jgi:limonene-1,2-epoxide hydrolase
MSSQENQQIALAFFKSWEKGSFSDLVESYRSYLAPDVIYENPGVPACKGIDESIKLIESVCLMPNMDIQTIRVELKSIGAVGDLVFSERVDWHYDSKMNAVLVPAICGVMQFEGGKIVRWADYFDPTVMMTALT